jgi:hypothetical protein
MRDNTIYINGKAYNYDVLRYTLRYARRIEGDWDDAELCRDLDTSLEIFDDDELIRMKEDQYNK